MVKPYQSGAKASFPSRGAVTIMLGPERLAMNAHHQVLLAALQKHRRRRLHSQANDSYLSSGHVYLDVSVPVRRMLAKQWLKQNAAIHSSEFFAALDSLYRGDSHEEKTLASIMLSYAGSARGIVKPAQLDRWLDHLVGWAEIDSLCQSSFTAEEILPRWGEWSRFIRALSRSKNINKRRAALVFLTGPLRSSDDERLLALAFETIERLKHEREIIITKAVSWLLRSMTQRHRRAVAEYISRNRGSLPAVAVRETARKIATGRK